MLENNTQEPFPTVKAFIAVLIFCFSAIFFTLPLVATSIQESDGAEFALNAVLGGVPHPPGYPVYMLLTKFLVSIFPDNPYQTLAMFSLLSNVTCGALLILLAARLGSGAFLALAGALFWFFQKSTLAVSTDVEVFAFHNFLSILLVLACLLYYQRESASTCSTVLLGLFCGLCASHHHMIVLWAPLVLFIVLSKKGASKAIQHFALLSLSAIIGLTPYLLLFPLFRSSPELSFASVQSLTDFIIYVFRLGYGTFSVKSGSHIDDESQLIPFLSSTLPAISLHFLALFLLGLFAFRKSSLFFWGIFLSVLLHLIFTWMLKLPPDSEQFMEWVKRFYSPVTLALSVGLFVATSAFHQKWITPFLALLLLLSCMWRTPATLQSINAASDKTVALEVQSIIDWLPQKDAVLLTAQDRIAFGVPYGQMVLQEETAPPLIILGKLQSRDYQEKLKQRFPELRKLSPEIFSSEKAFIKALLAAEYKVFLSRSEVIPAGFHGKAFGPLKHILRKDQETPLNMLDENISLLKFCSSLPAELFSLPSERRRSRQIAQEHFFSALKEIRGDTLPRTRHELLKALKAELKKDWPDARVKALCQEMLSESQSPGA